MTPRAKFVTEVSVVDPDTGGKVEVSIYKHENGGMFGVDASYVDQVLDENDDMEMCIADPFMNSKNIVILED
jgi:hypothetical protein